MSLKSQEIDGKLYFFERGVASLLQTVIVTTITTTTIRKSPVPFLADFRDLVVSVRECISPPLQFLKRLKAINATWAKTQNTT